MTEEALRVELIAVLRANAIRHEEGDLAHLERDFDRLDVAFTAPLPDQELRRTVSIAGRFFEAWVDAANHGFGQQFVPDVEARDWPDLARVLAADLEAKQGVGDFRLQFFADRVGG